MGGLQVRVVTVVTASHVAYTRVLARSLRAFHPEVPLTVVLAERPGSVPAIDEPGVRTVPLDRLGVPDLGYQAFVNHAHGLTVVAKPFALQHLLDEGADLAVFLDADVLVTGDLSPFFATCVTHTVSLTPHLLEPPVGADAMDRELTLLRSGTFNGGCVAVGRGAEARRFLEWWGARVCTHNRCAPDAGLFHDQRWLDLVPTLFAGVGVIRDPGCNVAYWNVNERRPRYVAGTLCVAGGPCRFVHFSGFDPAHPEVVSRHTARPVGELGTAALVFSDYAARLRVAGLARGTPAPYSYARFDNGIAIPLQARELYRELDDRTAFGDPFRTGPSSYLAWLTTPDDRLGADHRIPRLWSAIYRQRPDLQRAFPDLTGRDHTTFLAWTVSSGLAEYVIDSRLAPASA